MKVIDDVISKEYQDYIEKTLYTVPWYLKRSLDENCYVGEKEIFTDVPGFANLIYSQQGIHQSKLFNTVTPLAYIAAEKINFKVNELLFARTFYQNPYTGKSGVTNPHVDIDDEEHLVCLYYVIDADGDTVFFDKRNDTLDAHISRPSFVNYNIINSVTPKKGRCVLFDGKQYHATTLPQNGPRCVINFNLGGYYV